MGAKLLLDMREITELGGSLMKPWVVDAFVIFWCIQIHTYFIVFAFWSLFRNSVVKHLKFLRGYLKGERAKVEDFLLNIVDHSHNQVEMEYESSVLDLSQLSRRECEFFHVAMTETLKV